MSTKNHHADAILDQNLRHLGQSIELPVDATPEQQARWKQMPAAIGTETTPHDALRFWQAMRRFAPIAAVVAFAAPLVVLLIITIKGATPATAATVFDGLRNALADSIWIDLERVDLGPVQVRGQIYLEFGPDPESSMDDLLYSELHVKLLADNPRWEDIDAVAVTSQTPDDAWTYTRGNGIGGPVTERPDGRLVPWTPESFVRTRSWSDILSQPLGRFGGIPIRMSLGDGEDQVTYGFPGAQRAYISSLMDWLLAFSGEATARKLIDDLEALAQDVTIDTTRDDDWILSARGDFGPPAAKVIPTITFDFVARFVPETGRLFGTETRNASADGQEIQGAVYDAQSEMALLLLGLKTIDELVAYLTPISESTEFDRSDPTQGILRAMSVTIPHELVEAALIHPPNEVELLIHYDPKARLVRRAEFVGVGSSDGIIRIELGSEGFDPALLDPAWWTQEATDRHQ